MKPKFTPEELAEHARIGREFNIQSQRRENKLNNDLSTKIWLMQDALKALPEKLRIEAEIIDESPPPKDRPIFGIWDTPPIKGFDSSKYDSKHDDDDSNEDSDSKSDKVVNEEDIKRK